MTDPKTFAGSLRLYGQMMLRAWSTAWGHKELWLLAALAGLANTGTVFQNVFETFWHVSPQKIISWTTIEEFFSGWPWLRTYLNALMLESPLRIGVTVGILGSQQLILTAATRGAKNKTHLTFRELAKYLRHLHFVRLLAVNIGAVLATTILFGLTALALSLLLTASLEINFFVYLAVYTLILPLALLANLLAMLCLVNVIRKNEGLIAAWHHSVRALRQHWLFLCELSLVLFIVNFLASTVLAAIFIGATLCLSVLAALALKAGSLLMMAIISVFTAALGALLIIAFGGLSTLFNYSVWAEASERTEKTSLLPALEHAVRHFLKPFRK
jgi:hypothetical protein